MLYVCASIHNIYCSLYLSACALNDRKRKMKILTGSENRQKREGAAMAAKTDAEVLIGGKVLTLSGNESEEYLQRVASYINNKINEYNKMDSFTRQPVEMQNVLLQLNIADDFFKAKKQISVLEEELQNKEKELYTLKHELISAQIKLETAENKVKELRTASEEDSKKIVRLEAELHTRK